MVLVIETQFVIDGIEPEILWRRPMSVPQASREVGVPERTFRRWVASGLVLARRMGGKWEVPRPVVARLKSAANGEGLF